MRKNGYRLVVDNITAGISETRIHYQLNALGTYDGVVHGWLYDWYNNYSPEGEVLTMTNGGRKLEAHLSSLNYRASRDNRTIVGQAYFNGIETSNVQIKLTDIYGYYNMNQIIPINGVKDKIDITKKYRIMKKHRFL